ncbi:paired immunoglobulin-like type 2 receptor alpha isoform 1-T1 [Rhynchonycteris naso]
MGLPLLLPLLLLLPASLQAGGSAKCKSNISYGVNQPEHLSAPEGGSTAIPFTFCYSWEPAKDPRESISWRWDNFHGKFIYNTTWSFTHKHFEDRLVLNWAKGERRGSLLISNLRKEDESTYFCRVQLTAGKKGKQVWQSIQGTKLTITRATEKTTKGPPSTSTTATTTDGTTATTTDGISVSRDVKPLTLGATTGVALAIAVLIIAILGLMVYLRRKRSKGLQTKARAPARTTWRPQAGPKGGWHPLCLACPPQLHLTISTSLPSSTQDAPGRDPILYPKVLRSGTER